jgi:hypothetical protein
MKKYLMMLLFTGSFLWMSCKKSELLDPSSSFDVSVPKITYKVGDTVTFKLSGNPDLISFFSGVNGKRYQYLNRLTAVGTPKLVFSSALANGTQPNSLMVMISNNFAGLGTNTAGTVANIGSATWTDITSRAVLSTGSTVSSGSIDLSDIAAAEKPVYIAFKYVAAAGSIQNKWTITNFAVTNVLADGTIYTIANHTATAITNYGVAYNISPGWVSYLVSNTYPWAVSTSSLVITGATTAATAIAPAESWTFAGPIDLRRVSPDYGVGLKNSTTVLQSYPYIYTTAGTYTATFSAANDYKGKEIAVAKSVTLTITP